MFAASGPEYGQPYASPSGGYPAQGHAGQPYPHQDPQATAMYGTPSGPPAQGHEDPTAPVSSAPGGGFGAEPAPRNKRLLLILAVVAVVVVLAAVGTVVTLALGGSSTSFAVNDCVKQDGSNAVKVSCSDSKAYRVTQKVSQQSDCPDANQPYVVVEHKGSKNDVLCLRPASQK
jgi:hypothetical protein